PSLSITSPRCIISNMLNYRVLLACVLAVGTFAACGSGTGAPSVPADAVRDPVANERDNPGSTRDDPGVSRDAPTPGTGGSTSCLVCDGTYHCTGVILGQAYSKDIQPKTRDGQCIASDTVIGCGGTIASPDNGQAIGSWKIDGQGTITFTLPG